MQYRTLRFGTLRFGILAALVCCLPSLVLAEDLQGYLRKTRALVRQGKNAEALERCLWFHENAAQQDKSQAAVRLSFALGTWDRLAEDYPPARQAMLEARDRATKRLLEDGGTFEVFQEAAAFNRTLQEDARTIELFEQLEKAYPNKTNTYWFAIKDQVIAAKRYDIAARYMTDLEQELQRIEHMYNVNLKLSKDPRFGADFKNYAEKTFARSVVQVIEVALATDRRDEAEALQQRALAVRDDVRIREAIPAAEGDAPQADSQQNDPPPEPDADKSPDE